MAVPLSQTQIESAVGTLADVLNQMGVTYGIVGGAAVSLITRQRQTADIDLIVQPAGDISGLTVSNRLIRDHPNHFKAVDQYGHAIPGLRLATAAGREILVEVEIFDVVAWPQRPQYNLNDSANARVMIQVGNGQHQRLVAVMSPGWLLREKISSQKEREGSPHERTDIQDITDLVDHVGAKAVKIQGDLMVDALKSLLKKKPALRPQLERAIDCDAVFPR